MTVGQHPYSSIVRIKTSSDVATTFEVNYLLYLPGDYGKDLQRKWPLILFLHGSGERGSDLELLKRQPLPKILDLQKDFPFVVLSPQLPVEMGNWNSLRDKCLGFLLPRDTEVMAWNDSFSELAELGDGCFQLGMGFSIRL